MDKSVAVVLTALIGGLVAIQAPINSKLGHALGTWQAVFISFVLGVALLAVIVLFTEDRFGTLSRIPNVPIYYFAGGIIGVTFVTGMLLAVRTLGAGGITVAAIAGQLAMAVVVDHFGLLGVAKSPVTLFKVLGIALLGAGTYLVIRDT